MAKDKLDDADKALFRQAVADARPLPQDKIKPARPRRAPIPLSRLRDEQAVLRESLSDPVDLEDIQTGEEMIYSREGIQTALLRKLRRGQIRIDAELDLHRLTRDKARTAITQFLAASVTNGKRCIRIIHGKGLGSFNKQPVLKGLVNHWLQQHNAVLAFCSARPNDGGTGALYVLLRKQHASS
jgi:DNA-nicking Smr family endonuclease